MIDYRPFRNWDPPQLIELWHRCGLGRGAAEGFTADALETVNFAQHYFDPAGLIVACEGEQVVGCVHAGFGANGDESGLSRGTGVICAVLVDPQTRRRGIGRELVSRAEQYLRAAGAADLFAGPAPGRDPFYVGLYGGSRPSGFLESDPDALPFFTALGWQPVERHAVFQRSLERSAVMNVRLLTVRRKMQLVVADDPPRPTWWWLTRLGRLDSLQFQLVPKAGGEPAAAVTIVGLDFYLSKWQERAVGLVDLYVPEGDRRQGYAQTLLVETCRRLKEEMITRVEVHAPESDAAAVGLLTSAGFEQVDAGVVYRAPT